MKNYCFGIFYDVDLLLTPYRCLYMQQNPNGKNSTIKVFSGLNDEDFNTTINSKIYSRLFEFDVENFIFPDVKVFFKFSILNYVIVLIKCIFF